MADNINKRNKASLNSLTRFPTQSSTTTSTSNASVSNSEKQNIISTINRDKTQCPCCQKEFASEHGMQTHKGRMHSDTSDVAKGEKRGPKYLRAKQRDMKAFTSKIVSFNQTLLLNELQYLPQDIARQINFQSCELIPQEVRKVMLKKFILVFTSNNIMTIGSTPTHDICWLDNECTADLIPSTYKTLSDKEKRKVVRNINEYEKQFDKDFVVQCKNDSNDYNIYCNVDTDVHWCPYIFDKGYVTKISGYEMSWVMKTKGIELSFEAVVIDEKKIVLIHSKVKKNGKDIYISSLSLTTCCGMKQNENTQIAELKHNDNKNHNKRKLENKDDKHSPPLKKRKTNSYAY
eukprot:91489_1